MAKKTKTTRKRKATRKRQKKAPAGRRDEPVPAAAGRVLDQVYQIAAIDVGTSSVRMRIAEAHPDGRTTTLEELIHPVSIGSDTFRIGYVSPQTMRALCRVLKNFSQLLLEYNVHRHRIVATSGIREASNQDILIDRIRHDSGITLNVLDAVEESRLTYQILLPFLQRHLAVEDQHTMLFDLGGGSTEIMVLRGEDLVSSGSRRLGTTRLFHRVVCADSSDTQSLLESVIRNVVNSTLDLYRAYPIRHCVIINPLLLQAFRTEPDARQLDGGLVLPVSAATQAIREATTLSAELLADRFHLSRSDADLALPAFLILSHILDHLHVQELYFAEIDLLAGVMHDIITELHGDSPLDLFGKQIIGSATGIAERYQYSAEHSQQVAFLADQLYMALADYLDLSGKDRLYLQIAAILHDIGMFVSERAHHKHSAYLVRWSEIVGLADAEQNLVSLLTRYHRKATPRPQHTEFMSLPANERLRVSKLASMLRIADALDRGHIQTIQSLRIEIGDVDLRLCAESTGDLSVEEAALVGKADLFEEITGLKVSLRRCMT